MVPLSMDSREKQKNTEKGKAKLLSTIIITVPRCVDCIVILACKLCTFHWNLLQPHPVIGFMITYYNKQLLLSKLFVLVSVKVNILCSKDCSRAEVLKGRGQAILILGRGLPRTADFSFHVKNGPLIFSVILSGRVSKETYCPSVRKRVDGADRTKSLFSL